MKSLFSLPLLLLLPFGEAAASDEGSFGFSASGGGVFTDHLEVLDNSWVVLPQLQRWVNPTVALEVGVGFSRGQTRDGIPETFSYTSVTPRVGMLGRVFADQAVNLTLGGGVGAWSKAVNDDGALDLPTGTKTDLDFLGHFGPGIMVPVGDKGMALRTDLRFMLSLGTENYQNRGDAFLSWEWTAGFAFGVPAGRKDSDKDGIPDDIDRCPNEPEDFDGWQDEDGCPDPDNDGDGILDERDDCPNEAEDFDGFQDEDGCPDPDNDGDGILDADDACPDQAGPEATKGCPDTDEDGLADTEDECPEEAGPAESFGCPDRDGDRVPDYRDACPDEPAHARINPMLSDGCPSRVYVSEKAIVITEKIQFDTGKATIKKESTALLEDIAKVLKENRNLKKLQIEGHTDNVGNPERNRELSEARAAAVQKWLIEQAGINAGRLTAKGFGQDKPLQEGNTDEARSANRRVEFNILEQEASEGFKRRPREDRADGADEADDEPKKAAPKGEGERRTAEPKAEEAEAGEAEEPKKAQPKAEGERRTAEPKADEPAAEEPKKAQPAGEGERRTAEPKAEEPKAE